MKDRFEHLFYIYLLILTFIPPIFSIYNLNFKRDWIISYNLILGVSLILLILHYREQNKINKDLLSQKLLLWVLYFYILHLLTIAFRLHLLSTSYSEHSDSFSLISTIFVATIPSMLIYYVSIFKKSSFWIITSIFSVVILITPIVLRLIGEFSSSQIIVGVDIEAYSYPSKFNVLFLVVSYFLLGSFILYLILKSNNFTFIRFQPLLARNYIAVISGVIIYFYIHPLLFLVYNLTSGEALFRIKLLTESVELVGLLLIIIPNFNSKEISINLIHQSVEKLVVMNTVGLPLFNHDFALSERIIHSDLLVTSSLTAIVTYLTHSSVITSRVKSIEFEDRILIFKSVKGFTFLLIVNQNNKILESALSIFIGNFLKQINPKISKLGYFKVDKIKNKIIEGILYETFGVRYQEIISSKRIEKHNSITEGQIIIAIFLVFSAFRLLFFTSTTILLPDEENLIQFIFILAYSSIVYIFGSIFLIKKIKFNHKLSYISLTLYSILLILQMSPIVVVLGLVLAILAWLNLLGLWRDSLVHINPGFKFRIITYGIILDIISRFLVHGTDLLIWRGSNLYINKIVLILTLLLLMTKGGRIELFMNKGKKISSLSLIPLNFFILILIRYYINFSQIYFITDNTSPVAYLIGNLFLFSFLVLFTSDNFIKLLFTKYKYFWVISTIVPLLYLHNLDAEPFIIALLSVTSLLSIIFIMAQLNGTYLKNISSQIWISTALIILPITFFVLMVFSYYGGSDFLISIPLLLIIIIKKPWKTISVNHEIKNNNNNNKYSILLILLILFSFSIPSQYDIPSFNNGSNTFGVMTYNIQFGINNDFSYNPTKVAQFIIESGVSVVGLQEVTRGSLINGNGDLFLQLAQILEKAGFKYNAIMENHPEIFTNVIFSKYPIRSYESFHFTENIVYTKGFVSAVLDVNGYKIKFVVTHLTHVYTNQANQTRISQTKELLDNLNPLSRTILVGDFNVEPTRNEIQMINSMFVDNWINQTDPGYTWPVGKANQRIDYIFSSGLNIQSVSVINSEFSDHFPIISWYNL